MENPKLQSFHKYFEKEYGIDRWRNSLYPALKNSKQEYACLLNSFAVAQDVMEALELNKEFFNQSSMDGKYSWLVQQMKDLSILGRISLLSAMICDSSKDEYFFPKPLPDRYQIKTHYMLDPSSLFPVEMLQVKTNHRVLDMCAAPGGKSLAICQLLFGDRNESPNGRLFANELDHSRRKRLINVLKEYLPKYLFDQDNRDSSIVVTGCDGTSKQSLQRHYSPNSFDRILIDACCSAERHLIQQPNILIQDWSIQHSTLKKPKIQKQLLLNGLELLKPGIGRLVYSTCSINPAENDQVIQHVLDQYNKKSLYSIQVVKHDCSFGEPTIHGMIILPDSHSRYHWGPAYFCILEKLLSNK